MCTLNPIINNALQDFLFPDKLKLAELGPLTNDERIKRKIIDP